MTKQEAIQQAYGGLYNPHIDENGWFDMTFFESVPYIDSIWEIADRKNAKIRPKSLRDIETNNFWIDAKDESKIPDEYCYCWILTKDGEIVMREWNPHAKGFYGWREVEYTHYQPIIKPQPPIY